MNKTQQILAKLDTIALIDEQIEFLQNLRNKVFDDIENLSNS
jgi:hypothetical protein